MEYCPVLVEIVDQRIKDYFKGNYLLQVWNKEGKKCYEKILKYQYLAFSQNCFFLSDGQTIKLIDLNQRMNEESSEIIIEPQESQVMTFTIGEGCKIFGFFENINLQGEQCLISLIETTDNQIDFVQITMKNKSIQKKSINFMQMNEVVPRNISLDGIDKFQYIINNDNFVFGIALRKSGKVDFYWNYQRVNSSEEEFFDIAIDFQNIYLFQKDGNKQVIPTKWANKIGLEVSENFNCDQKEWETVFYSKICQQFNICPSFCLLNTSFFLACGNIISLYDIIKKEWIKHFFFDVKIKKIFKNEKLGKKVSVWGVLENGELVMIDSENQTDPQLWEIKHHNEKIQGTLLKVIYDKQNYKISYFLSNDRGKINLYGLTREKLHVLSTKVQGLQDEGQLSLYQFEQEKNSKDFQITHLRTLTLNDSQTLNTQFHSAFTNNSENEIFVVDKKNLYKVNVQSNEVKTFQNQNIVGITLLDNTFLYCLCNSTNERKSGFYIYDLQQIIEENQVNKYILDDALAGINNNIDFSNDSERISYMVDYQTILIVPPLHRNTINFMGMLNRKEYLACKRTKNKFIALDTNNNLTTWCVTTGKLLKIHKIPRNDFNFKNYEIFQGDENDITYKTGWYQPYQLLKQKTAIENMGDDQHFDQEMLKTSFKDSKPYIKTIPKTFHNFKLIEIIDEQQIKELFTFIHPYYGKYQRLYISNDMEYMLERLENSRVFLYKSAKKKALYGQRKWQIIRRMEQWPSDMSDLTYANYLCSPDLMYYLDYDKKRNKFVIKHTINQTIYQEVPTSLMNPKDDKDVLRFAKNFKFIDADTIILLNNEGFEKIVDIKNQFQDIAISSVPLFNQILDYKHYYFTQQDLEIGDVKNRLKFKYQKYKQSVFLFKTQESWDVYEKLFDVDYSLNNCQNKYFSTVSFTYLHWKLAEELKNNKNFDVKQVSSQQIELLCYNIFPQCNHILHYIHQNYSLVQEFYDLSKAYNFEIPFIQNQQGQSAISLCLEQKQLKTADLIFKKLSKTSLDHHGKAIVESIPLAIQENIPSVGEYIDNRFLQSQQVKEIKKGCLNLTRSTIDYSYYEAKLWEDQSLIKQKLFRESPIEHDVKLEFLDIPKLHCYGNQTADQFIDALADTENLDIFSHKGIQTIIDYKWKIARRYSIYRIFIPLICYQVTFFVYSNGFFVWEYQKDISYGWHVFDYVIASLLLVFSAYFLFTEIIQLCIEKKRYFLSPWNYFDILAPTIIPILVICDMTQLEKSWQFTLHGICSLFLWLKFLHFLRIFSNFGYLIRVIIYVIKDLKIFFFILLALMCGFADAFLSVSVSDLHKLGQFAGDSYIEALLYTYRVGLGNFVLEDYEYNSQAITAYILFVLCTLLIFVVMMNILIALVIESFSKANSISVQLGYHQKAIQIQTKKYLIPKKIIEQKSDKGKYILIAKQVNIDGNYDQEQSFDKFDNLKQEFNERINGLENTINEKFQQLMDKQSAQ